jgi:hypothetical protein
MEPGAVNLQVPSCLALQRHCRLLSLSELLQWLSEITSFPFATALALLNNSQRNWNVISETF